jgi:hypothetical protein
LRAVAVHNADMRRLHQIRRRAGGGAVASLMSNGGNNYGLVFTDSEGPFGFNPDIEALVRTQPWQAG